jgi:hypothetical protein
MKRETKKDRRGYRFAADVVARLRQLSLASGMSETAMLEKIIREELPKWLIEEQERNLAAVRKAAESLATYKAKPPAGSDASGR